MYRQRFYRDFSKNEKWDTYRVRVESTDLYIRSHGNYAFLTQSLVKELRTELINHIHRRPEFLKSLTSIKPLGKVHPMIAKMYQVAEKASVGPMAAVAGAIAEYVGRELMNKSEEVIVENGGDNFLKLAKPGVNTIFAGKSPFSGKIGLRVLPEKTPLAVCTSSGTIGHSHSQGSTEAATIMAKDTYLADAVATGTANKVNSDKDFDKAFDYALGIQGVMGVVLIYRDRLAVKGELELVRL